MDACIWLSNSTSILKYNTETSKIGPNPLNPKPIINEHTNQMHASIMIYASD